MAFSASKYPDYYRPITSQSPRGQRTEPEVLPSHQQHNYRPLSHRAPAENYATDFLLPLPIRDAYYVRGSVRPMQRIYSDESPPNSTGPYMLAQPLSIPSNPLKRGSDTSCFDVDRHQKPRYVRSPEVGTTQWKSAMTGTRGMHRQVPQLGVMIPSSCTASKHVAYPPHRTSSIHKYPAQIYPPPQSAILLASPLLGRSSSTLQEDDAFAHERRASSQRLPSIRSPQVLGDHFTQSSHPTTYVTTTGPMLEHELYNTRQNFQDPWQKSSQSHPKMSSDYAASISPRHVSKHAPGYVPITSPRYADNVSTAYEPIASYSNGRKSSGSSGEMGPPPAAVPSNNNWGQRPIPRPGPNSIPRMLSAARIADKDRILNTVRQLASLPTPGEQSEGGQGAIRTIRCLYSFNGTCQTAPGDEGRTVIMHLVGRNKTEATSLKSRGFIEKSCRRHYQRVRYHTSAMANNPKPENTYYAVIQGILLERIWDQVDREDPHAKWQICFTKSAGDHYRIEKKRMQASARGEDPDVVAPLRKGASDEHPQDAKAAINRCWARALLRDDVFEERILSKHYFDNTIPKDYKTTSQCRNALHWLLDILAIARGGQDYPEMENINELPEIEFLWKVPANPNLRER